MPPKREEREMDIFVNNVQPFDNPTETYKYVI